MSKKILLISGSDRKNSFNTQLIEYLLEKFKNRGLDGEILNYSNTPLLSQNTEFPTPKIILDLREKVRSFDALFIVSPEYNGSYSAILKNLVDWLSRAEVQGDNETPTVINGKLVGIGSVANSTYGKFVRKNLFELLTYVRMKVMPGEGLGVKIPISAWETGKLSLDEEQEKEVDSFIDEFIRFII